MGASNLLNNDAFSAVLRISLLLLAVLLAADILYVNLAFYHDDAFITLRYAQNFLAGEGVVWNPGERVQGYSNFLMLAAVSAIGAFNVDLVVASRIIGLASLAVLAGVLMTLGHNPRFGIKPQFASLPAILVATSSPVVVWSLGGLETLLYTLLVTVGCLAIFGLDDVNTRRRSLLLSGFALGLSYLARPDGIIFIAVTMLYIIVLCRKNNLL
jgi:arabinofuranosyltransferase